MGLLCSEAFKPSESQFFAHDDHQRTTTANAMPAKPKTTGCASVDATSPCRASCRLDFSIFAILCLYEAEQLTEGQAIKLMNCGSRVEFRILREKLHNNFRASLAEEMKNNGWIFDNP